LAISLSYINPCICVAMAPAPQASPRVCNGRKTTESSSCVPLPRHWDDLTRAPVSHLSRAAQPATGALTTPSLARRRTGTMKVTLKTVAGVSFSLDVEPTDMVRAPLLASPTPRLLGSPEGAPTTRLRITWSATRHRVHQPRRCEASRVCR
jgi:hypothetical protein